MITKFLDLLFLAISLFFIVFIIFILELPKLPFILFYLLQILPPKIWISLHLIPQICLQNQIFSLSLSLSLSQITFLFSSHISSTSNPDFVESVGPLVVVDLLPSQIRRCYWCVCRCCCHRNRRTSRRSSTSLCS